MYYYIRGRNKRIFFPLGRTLFIWSLRIIIIIYNVPSVNFNKYYPNTEVVWVATLFFSKLREAISSEQNVGRQMSVGKCPSRQGPYASQGFEKKSVATHATSVLG